MCFSKNAYPKDLIANLLLAAGGRGGISTGGDGYDGELTNWGGTKEKTDWGVVNCYTDLNPRFLRQLPRLTRQLTISVYSSTPHSG